VLGQKVFALEQENTSLHSLIALLMTEPERSRWSASETARLSGIRRGGGAGFLQAGSAFSTLSRLQSKNSVSL
jgi:hypothetical protein